MGQYKGFIREVQTRNFNGKTFYTAVLSTGDKIGFGMFPPKMNEGMYVEISAETNERGYLQATKKGFKELPAPAEEVSRAPSARDVSSHGGITKDDYWKRKEERDILNDKLRTVGASRNTAIEWIDVLLRAGALKLPKKIEDMEDALSTLLDEYTLKFMSNIEEKNNKNEESAGKSGPVGGSTGDDGSEGDWAA